MQKERPGLKRIGHEMRILYLIDAQGGGAMTHVLDLAEGVIEANIQAEILFFTDGPSIGEANKRKIPFHIIKKKGFGLVFIAKLYRFLKINRFDILHTHTINGNFYGRIAGKLAGITYLLTTVHSHIIDELKGLKEPSLFDQFRYRIDLFFSRWTSTLVVVAESIRVRLIKERIPVEKINVVENGVDINEFKPSPQIGLEVRKELCIPDGKKVIGIIGRMVPLKNHMLFLESAREVSKERQDVYFLIVGDGPLRDNIQKYAKSLEFGKRIIFTGWRSDINRIIPSLDILVLCSQVEGHNIVILEAMSCEKPVIGTDVRGIHSIIKNSENGILVPPGDPIGLAKTMLYLLNNPEKAEALGKAGRRYVKEKFSVDKMVSAYLHLYSNLNA